MIRKAAMVLMLGASVALTGCEEDDEGIFQPEFGVTEADFNRFDTDNDAVLNQGEFQTGFMQENVFDTLDQNRNNFIEANEFNNRLGDFNTFDVNSDAQLTENEFLGGTFNTFDTNDDLGVDQNEFRTGLGLF